jgi:hypothetical protein
MIVKSQNHTEERAGGLRGGGGAFLYVTDATRPVRVVACVALLPFTKPNRITMSFIDIIALPIKRGEEEEHQ